MQLIKSKVLRKGDTIAAITLSFGAAGLFPHRFEQGVRQIKESFGISVVPTSHALDMPEEVYAHPEYRLADLMEAFENPEIKGVLCNIGGDDTIRLLQLMNEKHFDIIRQHPKVFLGFSDTTVNHFMCFEAGLCSFYSPSLLFGYAENGGIPNIMVENAKKTLFSSEPVGILPESEAFIVDTIDWSDQTAPIRPRIPSTPWRYIQGEKVVQGHLLGGCFDVLMGCINGTSLWPSKDVWDGAILFLEISEERPSPSWIKYWLRGLGAQGILEKLNGLLFARLGNGFFKDQEDRENWLAHYTDYDTAILTVLKEYGRSDMPVVTHMDFGHTLPQLILPYGVQAQINPEKKQVALLENGVVDDN